MRFPIDVRSLSFIAGSDPAGVLDMEGRQRADKATGELLWGLDLVALGGKDGAEVWNEDVQAQSGRCRYEDELRRRRRLGELGLMPGSQETLDEYVCQMWAQTHAVTLSPKTAKDYAGLYDVHIAPSLGGYKLVELISLAGRTDRCWRGARGGAACAGAAGEHPAARGGVRADRAQPGEDRAQDQAGRRGVRSVRSLPSRSRSSGGEPETGCGAHLGLGVRRAASAGGARAVLGPCP
jgi:hypothetical protein